MTSLDQSSTSPPAELPAAPPTDPAPRPGPAAQAAMRLVGRIFFLLFLICLGLTTQPALRTAGRIGMGLLTAWLILMMWTPTRRYANWPVVILVLPWTFYKCLRLHEDGVTEAIDGPPGDQLAAWQRARGWLLRNRFRSEGLWDAGGYSSGLGVETRVAIESFAGPEPGLSASIYAERAGAAPTAPPILEFAWFFTDGRYLLVNDSHTPPLWGDPPHHDTFRFPGVDDPGELFRLARAARSSAARPAPRSTPEGDCPHRLALGHQRSLAHWVKRKFLKPAPDGRYRLTLNGALRLTVITAPPFSTIARRRLRRRAESLRRSLLENARA